MKRQIKNIFSQLLGANVIVHSDGENEELLEKELFVSTIKEWGNAWKQQNTLFNKYGIDLSGYDQLLYGSIEKLVTMLFGSYKTQVVLTYVYSSLNLEEDSLKITDKHNKEHYITTPEQLFDFLMTISDDDLIRSERIDDEDDEDNEGN